MSWRELKVLPARQAASAVNDAAVACGLPCNRARFFSFSQPLRPSQTAGTPAGMMPFQPPLPAAPPSPRPSPSPCARQSASLYLGWGLRWGTPTLLFRVFLPPCAPPTRFSACGLGCMVCEHTLHLPSCFKQDYIMAVPSFHDFFWPWLCGCPPWSWRHRPASQPSTWPG